MSQADVKKEKYYCVPTSYPKELIDIAQRRTEDLLSRIESTPVSVLIQSAYLIGCIDGFNSNGKQSQESPIHGFSCPKVVHGESQGYLHDAQDDSPYLVDGAQYCGRCHAIMACTKN